MGEVGAWLVLLFFVGLVVALLLNARAMRRRGARWRAIAAKLGLKFSPDDPFDTARTHEKQFFHQGHSALAYNVMYGTYKGVRVRCFDYRLARGTGRNTRTLYFTCLLVALPVRFWPLTIRREDSWDWLGHLVGMHDIQFESDALNRTFAVFCTNTRFAYDVIHPRMMNLILRHQHRVLEASGMSALIFNPLGQVRVEDLEADVGRLLEYGIEFVGLLPQYLQAARK